MAQVSEGTLGSVKYPSTFDEQPSTVPRTDTDAKGSGSPLNLSLIIPVAANLNFVGLPSHFWVVEKA